MVPVSTSLGKKIQHRSLGRGAKQDLAYLSPAGTDASQWFTFRTKQRLHSPACSGFATGRSDRREPGIAFDASLPTTVAEALLFLLPYPMPNGNTSSPAKQKPAYTVALSDVSSSVFAETRTTKDGKRDFRSYSVSLQRSYVDPKTDKRVYTNSLFERDLLDASQALIKAYHWIETDRREYAKATAQEKPEANGES